MKCLPKSEQSKLYQHRHRSTFILIDRSNLRRLTWTDQIFSKKSGIIKIILYQDLDKNNKITKEDLIFKGKVTDAKHSDELINFVGTIKLKKQMHSCDWEKQKQPGEFIACTRDYVPTLHELMLKPDSSGEKIYAEGLGEFRN